MKAPVRKAVESALIAAGIGFVCLWMLVSGADEESASAARSAMYGIGLAISLIAHWTYMGLAIARDGRAVWPWVVGMVLLFPIVSVVALVLMSSQEDSSAQNSA
jgi:uncharacterized membrane protein YhhN